MAVTVVLVERLGVDPQVWAMPRPMPQIELARLRELATRFPVSGEGPPLPIEPETILFKPLGCACLGDAVPRYYFETEGASGCPTGEAIMAYGKLGMAAALDGCRTIHHLPPDMGSRLLRSEQIAADPLILRLLRSWGIAEAPPRWWNAFSQDIWDRLGIDPSVMGALPQSPEPPRTATELAYACERDRMAAALAEIDRDPEMESNAPSLRERRKKMPFAEWQKRAAELIERKQGRGT